MRIGELRRVNVQLNHTSLRIDPLAGSNGVLCRCDWILFRRACGRAEPLYSH